MFSLALGFIMGVTIFWLRWGSCFVFGGVPVLCDCLVNFVAVTMEIFFVHDGVLNGLFLLLFVKSASFGVGTIRVCQLMAHMFSSF